VSVPSAALRFVVALGLATVSPAVASPELGRIDGYLGANGTSTAGVWIDGDTDRHETPTAVYRWPNYWAAGSAPAGALCANYAAAPGTLVSTVIHASGGYRRCAAPAPLPPSAPEPARVRALLSGAAGTRAEAVFISSGAPTLVVKWPATLTADTTLEAGMRCSTADLGMGLSTYWIIQVHGAYRKCVDPVVPAPEPVRLTEPFSDEGVAAGVFVNGRLPTSVVLWEGTWTANTTLKPGTPCSTVGLEAGQETTMTIQANGNYRRCS
jgi:hypothetical protein